MPEKEKMSIADDESNGMSGFRRVGGGGTSSAILWPISPLYDETPRLAQGSATPPLALFMTKNHSSLSFCLARLHCAVAEIGEETRREFHFALEIIGERFSWIESWFPTIRRGFGFVIVSRVKYSFSAFII